MAATVPLLGWARYAPVARVFNTFRQSSTAMGPVDTRACTKRLTVVLAQFSDA